MENKNEAVLNKIGCVKIRKNLLILFGKWN